MVKYILADLVRVRTLRKDRVERELLAAKERLAEAERQVPIREKELDDYRNWVDAEIDRLYTEIIRKSIHKNAVDDLAYAVRSLRGKEPEYVKRLQDARDDVKKAQELVEEKKKERIQAQKDLEKLDAHREEWLAEQAKLEEFLSDKELEESFRPKDSSESVQLEEEFA
ncbi:MAG: type III secretion protein [Puniceicoccales bacterium]|jgi:chromosome segregation ATPase|nr:type III secretion protein [Puniceicoccales bacterium]